jgi:hypothetical protein
MRRVISSTYLSLDGVVTNPQEWTFAFRDDTANRFAFEQLMASDALLMGRARTRPSPRSGRRCRTRAASPTR